VHCHALLLRPFRRHHVRIERREKEAHFMVDFDAGKARGNRYALLPTLAGRTPTVARQVRTSSRRTA
jgi:hypothetical protein